MVKWAQQVLLSSCVASACAFGCTTPADHGDAIEPTVAVADAPAELNSGVSLDVERTLYFGG